MGDPRRGTATVTVPRFLLQFGVSVGPFEDDIPVYPYV